MPKTGHTQPRGGFSHTLKLAPAGVSPHSSRRHFRRAAGLSPHSGQQLIRLSPHSGRPAAQQRAHSQLAHNRTTEFQMQKNEEIIILKVVSELPGGGAPRGGRRHGRSNARAHSAAASKQPPLWTTRRWCPRAKALLKDRISTC